MASFHRENQVGTADLVRVDGSRSARVERQPVACCERRHSGVGGAVAGAVEAARRNRVRRNDGLRQADLGQHASIDVAVADEEHVPSRLRPFRGDPATAQQSLPSAFGCRPGPQSQSRDRPR